ncbi:MAG: alpha/beta fold hydrolase [Aggregatilineales bacterium]
MNTPKPLSDYGQHHFIETNGIKLHTFIAGDKDGDPIFLLHGFPEFWYAWRRQIPYLVGSGYRVIVPDLRGYNLSDKPDGIASYRISTLARDVAGLADALGYNTFNLVGHDWGAAVSWWVATMFPQRLKKLIILNVPYPSIMAAEFRKFNLSQLRKSWYMFFFQIPALPEALMSMNDYKNIADMIQNDANPGSFSDADMDLYREAWGQPGAMKSMLHWYRAMIQSGTGENTDNQPRQSSPDAKLRITVSTLILWGEQDVALDVDLAHLSLKICDDGKLHTFPDATHWLQHDEPDAVNQHIRDFVSEDR